MSSTRALAAGSTWQTVRGAFRFARQPALDVTVVVPATALPSHTDASSRPGQDGARPARPGEPSPGAAAVREAVARAVAEHAAALGVPARPAVTVTVEGAACEPPQIAFAGRRARVVRAELDEALAAQGLSAGWDRGDDEAGTAAAVAIACRVAIEHDPSVLIGPQQRATLLAKARAAGVSEYGDDVLAAALEQIVTYGMRISGLSRLRGALTEQTGLARSANELAEVAIGVLGGPSIAVTVHEHTLRSATMNTPQPHAFVDMRQRLFNDLGITFPDIEVKTDDGVPEGTAVVRLNDVVHAPRPLPAGACTADIAALLEARLRAQASWFISLTEVHRTIEEMKLALPDLVSSVLDRYSEHQLCLFGRTFVAERVPVRNVGRLMVLLLDVPPPGVTNDLVRLAEPTRLGDERAGRSTPGMLVSYTRQQMNQEAARSQPGLAAVSCTRLPADLDANFSALPISPARVEDDVRPADRDRLMRLAEDLLGQDRPTLVAATQGSRGVARRLLVRQYPEVTVIAAEELPPSHELVRASPAPQPASTDGALAVNGEGEVEP